MNDAEYFKDPALSKSGLMYFAKSPAHFKAPRPPLTPQQKAAMDLGRALHCRVLEPDRFNLRFEILPAGMTYQTKEGKRLRKEAEEAGKTMLKYDDAQDVIGMADAIRHHPGAGALVKAPGPVEDPVFWKDPKYLFEWKCKPDKVTANCMVIDIKTTGDARIEEFQRTAWNLKYHWQAFIYLWGLTMASGTPHKDFVFIVVERKPPYGVMVYFTPPHVIHHAACEIDPLREKYARCLKKDEWPSYPENPEYLTLPPWAKPPKQAITDTTLFLEGG